MSDFWIYFEVGVRHVLNIFSYDHVLFLIALSVPYVFKDWKKILILVSLFTLGHTLALFLSVYEIIVVKVDIIEFLIPITILITAFFHLFTVGKTVKNNSISIVGVITLFFGIIHGLGFATYFKSIIGGTTDSKLLPLLEFATGIEAAQIIVVLIALIAAYCLQTLFRFSKRDWTLVTSSFVIGVVLPMIIESKIWIK
ncbi:MAG: HupE/UreJ family protein [Flavobacterium sp.]|nr:HupE/UreJ family protein [Flavobacterium sp.]